MFEQYLIKIHSKNYSGIDDNMMGSFELWLSKLTTDEWISLGDQFGKTTSATILGSSKSEAKSKSSRENGKKGGRPKKLDI